MRCVSYNILDGGEGRADPLAEVILAQNADVVAIVEADDAGVMQRLSQRLGKDMVIGAGAGHAVALLSRWRIGDTVNHAAIRADGPRCFLSAEVFSPEGAVWHFSVVHFSPRATDADERRRESELSVLLDVLAPLRRAERRHVVMGDFNANAPYQRIDPTRCKEKTRRAWEQNGGMIPRRVVARLLDEGYLDTLRAANPSAAENVGTFSTQMPGQRVDYVFAYGVASSTIVGAWVETDRLARYASDHFPVGAELAD